MLSAICHNDTTWWWLRIHDTPTELARAADRMTVRRHIDDPQPPDTLACFQPASFWYHVDNRGNSTPNHRNGYAGTMRLCRDHITTEIITHECVHLALRIYRSRHDEQATLGTDCAAPEEHLAYLIGETTSTTTDTLYSLGVWN
jgi:hypothetical protein